MKKVIVFALIIICVVTMVSCDSIIKICYPHVDEDSNYLCDKCDKELEGYVPLDDIGLVLIKDNVAKFQIVIGNNVGGDATKKINDFIKEMNNTGIDISRVYDTEGNAQACEILIGDVSTRGEQYLFDRYSLGENGYIVKRVGSKVMINGGSDAALATGIQKFIDVVIKDDEYKDSYNAVIMKDEDSIENIQGDYLITKVTNGGNDMRGYTIAVNKADSVLMYAAKQLQASLYSNSGYWFEIVSLANADKSIVIQMVEKSDPTVAGSGFAVFSSGDTVYVNCAYSNMFLDAFENLMKRINGCVGELNFPTDSQYYSQKIDVLYYKDFATIKGDGQTNDFQAIKAVHDLANKSGQKVVAEDGKTYYIGKSLGTTIKIKTDVDFGSAIFIIDDSIIEHTSSDRTKNIFTIESDNYTQVLPMNNTIVKEINERGGLNVSDTNIGFAPGYPALIIPYNGNVNIDKRWGPHKNEGKPQHEVVLVDENGNIDPTTPLMFDYEEITSMRIIRVDEEPLTVTGGTFTTIANCGPSDYYYYDRGIGISRSNVIIKNVKHYVTEEGETSSPYTGFINPYECHNLLVEDCILTGHKTYSNKVGTMGTYDISGSNVNKMVFKNCVQSNFFKSNGVAYISREYWGIMGTNYCKNIEYHGCTLSRLDAHAGVWNVTVKDSKVVYISFVGGGTATVENSEVYNSSVITLRSDYGSTWRGDIIIKDTKLMNTSFNVSLITGAWNDYDFGYDTYMPTNVVIDNFTTANAYASANVFSYSDVTEASVSDQDGNKNKLTLTSTIIIRNNQQGINYNVAPYSQSYLRNNIEITEE